MFAPRHCLRALCLVLLAAPAFAQSSRQLAWDACFKSFQEGEPATAAIRRVWADIKTTDLKLIARVVGAVYADHYWDRTKTNRELLAADLQSAIGIDQVDATRIANLACSYWGGLVVRANLTDQDNIPRGGTVTISPDVIISDVPLTSAEIIKDWNRTIWSPGARNYVYGRAQSINMGVDIKKAVLRAYISEAGIAPPPEAWVQLYTSKGNKDVAPLKTTDGKTTLRITERAASGGGDGFEFTTPKSGHYCVIVVARSEFFRNDPLASSGVWDSLVWLRNNGAVGWHAVNVTTAGTHALKYWNRDETPQNFTFRLNANKLPKGTKVSLVDTHPGLRSISASLTVSGAHHHATTEARIPAKHEGKLQVTIKTPSGGVLPKGSSVEVAQYWQILPDHKDYAKAVAHLGEFEAFVKREPIEVRVGAYAFAGENYGQ